MNRRHFLQTSGLALSGALLARAPEAQPVAQPGSFAFAVIADPHLKEDKPEELPAAEKLRRALQKMKALPQPPEFLLVLGDIHLDPLRPLLPEITIPTHYIAGNHETADHRKAFREMFPQDFHDRDFYAFTHGGCRFIGMCTAMIGDHVGHFESQDITPAVGQVEWLEQELAQSRELPHRFVFAHVPPTDGKPLNITMGTAESRYLNELVAKEKVTAGFFGHRHIKHEYPAGNTRMLLVPSLNWNFGTHPTGFMYVKVNGPAVEIEFIPCPPKG